MTITMIKKGNGEKYHLHIDGHYLLTIHEQVMLSHNLSKDDEVDGDFLDMLQEESGLLFAKSRAINLIACRERTQKQLFDRLTERCDEETAQQTVERMKELGLVNDESYARRYAADLVHLKRYGPRRIREELRRRGIDGDTIETVLEEMEDDPGERLSEIIERRYLASLDDPKGRKRAFDALVRMGYGFDDIRAAMRRVQENSPAWEE